MSYTPSGKHTVDGRPWWNPKVKPPAVKKPKPEPEPEPSEAKASDEEE